MKIKFLKSNYLLLGYFIIISLSILLKSYYNVDGYLSPDSTNYLRLAQNLIDGNGFEVSAYYHIDKSKEYFAIWPIGYPIMIFIASKLTGLSVFWASKLLNIIFIGLILITFKFFFKQKAWVYSLILFMSSFQYIYTFTWSEAPFILFLLWFSITLYIFVKSQKANIRLVLLLMLISLSLFLLRYIGFFSFIVLGSLGFVFLFINKRKAFILLTISISNIILSELYLYNNYIQTGHLTGAYRKLATESSLYKLTMMSKGILEEILIPFTNLTIKTSLILLFEIILIFSIIIINNKYFKYRFLKNKIDFKFISLFIYIAGAYWFSLFFLRWKFYFDDLNYRLLGPGTFIIWIVVFYIIEKACMPKTKKILFYVLISLSIISFAYNSVYMINLNLTYNHPYHKTIDKLQKRYKNIPNGAAVIFGSKHIIYIRSDVIDVQTYHFKPNEDWESFVKRVSKFDNVYVEITDNKKTLEEIKKLNHSVMSFIKKHKTGEVIKLK